MRPKLSGPGSVWNRPGPGDPAAVAAAPLSATNPAPEPYAVPEPASAQAPAPGQRAGSGSTAVSGPSAGARRASVAGSEAGTQRASAFSAVQGNAQSVPDNSDASRTRFIFQGPPFGPRATGLGTGKATRILTAPAAYIGQRPGVSDPERAAFIRELEEGKLGPRAPGGGLVGLGQQQGGGGPVGSRRPLALSSTPPPTLAKSRSAAPLRARLPRIRPRFSRSQTSFVLCPDLRPPVEKITQEEVKMMSSLLEEWRPASKRPSCRRCSLSGWRTMNSSGGRSPSCRAGS